MGQTAAAFLEARVVTRDVVQAMLHDLGFSPSRQHDTKLCTVSVSSPMIFLRCLSIVILEIGLFRQRIAV